MNEKRLSAYCRAEVENLDRLLVEIKKITVKSNKVDPTLVELAALGTFFHNFYNGIENILKRILLVKNISLPLIDRRRPCGCQAGVDGEALRYQNVTLKKAGRGISYS